MRTLSSLWIVRGFTVSLAAASVAGLLLALAPAAWGAPGSPLPAPLREPDVASRKGLPKPLVEVMLIGPRARCEASRDTISSVVAAPGRVTWTFREAVSPDPWMLSSPTPETSGPTLFVDLATKDEIRLAMVLRSGEPAATRTVSRGTDDESVLEESVAQIVAATLRALAEGRAPPLTPAPLAPSVAAEVSPIGPGSSSLSSTLISKRATRVERSPAGETWSLEAALGAHTSPFNLAEPHTESNWLGFSFLTELRREWRHTVVALRATLEWSERSIDSVILNTRYHTLAGVLARRGHFGGLYFSGGVMGGLLVLRQASAVDPSYYQGTAWQNGLSDPQANAVTWSTGFVTGFEVEGHVHLSDKWYVIAHATAPLAVMYIGDGGANAWHGQPYVQLVGGLGAHL